MQQGVSIVKASAGSGKTYRLTQDYIDLLLSGDTQRYKHILAVTFTNKATDEMKSRVIEELDRLSRSDDARAPLAADRLRRMLHDYTCFSVSTIDKFFQTVMRSFAREIGQYASYRVELDTDAVLDQVVDLLLDSIEDPAHDALGVYRRHLLGDAASGPAADGEGVHIGIQVLGGDWRSHEIEIAVC